jgi:hypothetical protein
MIVSFPLPVFISPCSRCRKRSGASDRVITITSIESDGAIVDAVHAALPLILSLPFPVSRVLPLAIMIPSEAAGSASDYVVTISGIERARIVNADVTLGRIERAGVVNAVSPENPPWQ